MRHLRHILSTALFLLICVAGAELSAQTSRGILAGVVRDPTGAAIASATITVRNEATGETRTATTGASGAYRIDALAAGAYQVHVGMAGFNQSDSKGVAVRPSVVSSFDPILSVGNASESVTVEANSVELNTTNGTLSNNLGEEEINKVPIFSLNPIELATTVAGVQTVRNSGFSGGQNIQVSGSRPRANNFLIDGQEINDTSIAGQAVQPQVPFFFKDTVVFTHNPPAEFGRASGGVVNLISASGTNQFHGQAWELYTGSGLNALSGFNRGDFYSGTKTRFNQHQFGFVAGGPIFKDKLFVFGGTQFTRYYGKEVGSAFVYPNAAGITLLKAIAANAAKPVPAAQASKLLAYLNNGAYLTTYGPASGGGTTANLDATGVCPGNTPCSIVTQGFRRPSPAEVSPDTQWTYHVDYNLGRADTFFLRYLHDRSSLTPDLFANPGSDIGFDTQQGGPSETGQGGWTHIFTPHVVNELRVAETRVDFEFAPTAATNANPLRTAPQLSFGGAGSISSVGYNSNFPQGRKEDLYQVQDTVSYAFGRNTVRIGGDVGRQLNVVIVPQNNNGSANFTATTQQTVGGVTSTATTSALSNFLLNQTGTSGSVLRSFGPSRFDPHLWRLGGFVQDDIKLSTDLTINLGARYDYITPPENALPYPSIDPSNPFGPIATYVPVKADKNDIAPRIGFAYNPHFGLFSSGNTVMRGGFGVFFDSDFTNIAYNSATTAPNSFSNTLIVTTGVGVTNATTGAIASISPSLSQTGSVTSVVNNLRSPYTYEYNLGFEEKLPGQFTAVATYVGTRGLKLYANQQYNYFNPAGTTRLSPTRGAINARGNFADSNYNGIETSLERKFRRGLLFRGTYTFSKTLDDGSEVFTADTETTSYTADLSLGGRRQDYSNSAYDHRHFASFLYVWSPAGFRSDNKGLDFVYSMLTRGFTISGTEQFQSGTYGSFNFGGGADTNNDGSAFNDRPIVGNASLPITKFGVDGYYLGQTPGQFYDYVTNAPVNRTDEHFLLQHGQQFLRQEIGRNSYLNPGAQFHNIALEKSFAAPFKHFEGSRFTLRAESQNFVNHNNTGILDLNLLDVGTDSFLNKLNGREDLGRTLKLWAKYEF